MDEETAAGSVGQPPRGVPRLAILSNSSGVYDARTMRIARSAVQAGYSVTVYARLQDGLPAREDRDGYRIIRAPWNWWLAVPVLRRLAGSRIEQDATGITRPPDPVATVSAPDGDGGSRSGRTSSWPRRIVRRVARGLATLRRITLAFPMRPMGWAVGLDAVAEPADIWHGMWAGSLPALLRLRRAFGGRTIYDSRDVFMESREYATAPWPLRDVMAWCERRWARQVDRVLTVNEAYAGLIEERLGVARPTVVMNCPERWWPPDPSRDLIRGAIGIPRSTAVVLYQGQLTSQRGIEQAMDAILEVPNAALVLLGFGRWERRLRGDVQGPRYRGRVFVLDAVAPDELLAWTASADVSIMAIQPTTLNHRDTTPQKLFESIAAGVPVVASDLPGMAAIVRSTGAGVLCDPTSPRSIADAIRSIIEAPAEERAALRARTLAAAHETYNWEAQVGTLLDLYGDLLVASPASGADR
jgi:glycosyltransferase involved in cell wall biosynthesis